MPALRVLFGVVATSLFISIVRFVGTVCWWLGIQFLHVDVEALLSETETRLGRRLSLRSNPTWREGLHLLEQTVNRFPGGACAQTRYFMRRTIRDSIIVPLINVEQALLRHSEILKIPIEKPVFISGVGRNGSTLFQKLLCCYPSVRYLSLADTKEPLPCDVSREFDPAWRQEKEDRLGDHYRISGRALFDLRLQCHELAATGPEECAVLLSRYHFVAYQQLLNGMSAGDKWLCSKPKFIRDVYEAYKHELQLLLFYDKHCHRSTQERSRYIVKCICHTLYHDVIREIFPNAYIVRMHRDPAKVVPSHCSLQEALLCGWGLLKSKTEIGRGALEWVSMGCGRMAREGRPANTIDVRYQDLMDDPIGVCRRVASLVGLEHNEEVTGKIRCHLEESPKHKHGIHKYSPEDYGLNGTEIPVALKEYCEMFNV